MSEEEIVRKQARITAIEAQKTALRAATNVDFRALHDASVAQGDALMAINYLAGGEGRKGKG